MHRIPENEQYIHCSCQRSFHFCMQQIFQHINVYFDFPAGFVGDFKDMKQLEK